MAFFAMCMGISATAETIVTIYYGEKANNSYKNPCKGETVRVCGKIVREINPGDEFPIVTETVMDGEGVVLSRSSYQAMEPSATVVGKILTTVPGNAATTIIADNEDISED